MLDPSITAKNLAGEQLYQSLREAGRQKQFQSSSALATSITKAASRQTYYTVRFLVDRPLIPDAYRAYAYFRWLDDSLDRGEMTASDRLAFVDRQRALVDHCYRGKWLGQLMVEERMLAGLVRRDREKNSGLRSYIDNMMAVMAFDADRRGRLVSQEALTEYTRWLATAVTEALHYFIGHNCPSPYSEARYLAATAAHITHMLRDTVEDTAAGYFNVPGQFLQSHEIGPADVDSPPYRAWVQSRVQLARDCFQAGKGYLAHVENFRCRLAGYAYIARFEGVLDAIECDGYRLRANYAECGRLGVGLRKGWPLFWLILNPPSGDGTLPAPEPIIFTGRAK